MKLAVTGKGGVGKSTLAAALTLLLVRRGRSVLSVDADPDANLASSLGISPDEQTRIVPIARQTDLIESRTGAKVNRFGQMFKLNPRVEDIVKRCAYRADGFGLMILGAVDKGGGGCACPESVFIRALVSDLILHKDEALVMDMEAGIEHLGRATARGVDCMLVVVEPGRRSIDCAQRIVKLAHEIGITNLKAVANKVTSDADESFIREHLPELPLLGVIPYSNHFCAADRAGRAVTDEMTPELTSEFERILDALEIGDPQ